MSPDALDNVDKGILFLLQEDPRYNTTSDIGEAVGVSSSTVGNRINRLEEHDIITGYHPTINYENAGLDHHHLVTGTVALDEQETIVDEIMDVSGVVSVRQVLSSNENVSIEVVGRSQAAVKETVSELNAVGVEIERMEVMRTERVRTFDHFGEEHATGADSG